MACMHICYSAWLFNLSLNLRDLIKVGIVHTVSVILLKCSPADTWRLYNVALTSMQRHDVASTLRRRCIDVMCPLGLFMCKSWSCIKIKCEVSREYNWLSPPPPKSFPTDRFKPGFLLRFFFVRLWLHKWRLCCYLSSHSSRALGGLGFMIVAFPEYFHLYF